MAEFLLQPATRKAVAPKVLLSGCAGSGKTLSALLLAAGMPLHPHPLRITPNHIIALKPHEVFVFGSNEAGRHSRGAALTAKQWGARKSVPAGRAGQTYAIPTKPADVRVSLCLRDISKYVDDFVKHAQSNPHEHFLVTEIGCGLAGYTPRDIAPLFRGCVQLSNVSLPARFWAAL